MNALRWVIPGNRLLPYDRAAKLQSGSPPGIRPRPTFLRLFHGFETAASSRGRGKARSSNLERFQFRDIGNAVLWKRDPDRVSIRVNRQRMRSLCGLDFA